MLGWYGHKDPLSACADSPLKQLCSFRLRLQETMMAELLSFPYTMATVYSGCFLRASRHIGEHFFPNISCHQLMFCVYLQWRRFTRSPWPAPQAAVLAGRESTSAHPPTTIPVPFHQHAFSHVGSTRSLDYLFGGCGYLPHCFRLAVVLTTFTCNLHNSLQNRTIPRLSSERRDVSRSCTLTPSSLS